MRSLMRYWRETTSWSMRTTSMSSKSGMGFRTLAGKLRPIERQRPMGSGGQASGSVRSQREPHSSQSPQSRRTRL